MEEGANYLTEPFWARGGWSKPYMSEPHYEKFRVAVREFVEREYVPYFHDWDEAKSLPREVIRKTYEAGILPGFVGAPWPSEYVEVKPMGGVSPAQYDALHEMILIDEVARAGSILWGLCAGLTIGLPPVLHFGSKEMRARVCPPCLRGEKIICLAITEPAAGSDVANLTTTAVKSADGTHYVLNGEKKWITNGVTADYFTVACRTGGAGMGGVSLLLVERAMPGVTTRQMQCQGVWSSGTSYITFEDVKVPAANLIGKENHGFKYIMLNFNHERWTGIVQGIRLARCCIEDAWKYANKRVTFGRKLIEHPVIRHKLAHMARQVEASQAWLLYIVFQIKSMPPEVSRVKLAGPIALLKAQMSVTLEYCAREAAQIFGGLAYTRGGQGGRVERIYREVRAYSIPAGSEEIMLDLGVRQSLHN